MELFHAPYGYWIGPAIESLPERFSSVLQQEFSIFDCQDDVSVLTDPDVNYVLFYLTDNNSKLLNVALKIALNLNKRIIIFHYGQLPRTKAYEEVVEELLDLSEPDAINRIKARALQLSLQHSNIKPEAVTEIAATEGVNSQSGNRIDIFTTLKYIEENLDKDIREEDVADLCHYSVSYFSKLFHSVIGISFRDYLTSKRINKAKHLLAKQQNEKIASIAYQCGYNDVSYFSRIFKKKTGMTPGNYRKINQSPLSHI